MFIAHFPHPCFLILVGTDSTNPVITNCPTDITFPTSMLFNIVGTDSTNPVITNCPTDITQTVAAGQTTAAVTWTPPTATDNITPTDQITVVATHTSGQQFPVGTTPVSYIFRDLAGNEATCTFNVNVQSKLFIVFLPVCTLPNLTTNQYGCLNVVIICFVM